jgi:hypothetical protein
VYTLHPGKGHPRTDEVCCYYIGFYELIETFLLLQEIESGWLCGLFLQGQMHMFMPAILLSLARLDALKHVEGMNFLG